MNVCMMILLRQNSWLPLEGIAPFLGKTGSGLYFLLSNSTTC